MNIIGYVVAGLGAIFAVLFGHVILGVAAVFAGGWLAGKKLFGDGGLF